MSLLASPSGRSSMRRAMFALVVTTTCGVIVYAVATHYDIPPGTASVISMALGATAGAVTVGRFAEKTKEAEETK